MTRRLTRREVLAGLVAGSGVVLAGCAGGGDGAAGSSPTTAPSTSGTTGLHGPRYLAGLAPESRLGPGDRPDPDQPEGTDLLPQIEHIVVLMMENHSYDNYLGMLDRPDADGFDLGADGRPTNSTPDADGNPVRAFHLNSTLPGGQGGQNWADSHRQFDHGTNQGFARDSRKSMGYWDRTDIPFYHGLAETFPVCDRYFSSVLSQTYPNRRFLQAGTALGLNATTLPSLDTPPPPNGTIYDSLNRIGRPWMNYYGLIPDCALFPSVYLANQDKTAKLDRFFADAASGDLPGFAMLTAHIDIDEEDNPITEGEAFTANVVQALMDGPAWDKTVLVFAYDEHGGYYDHVPPPRAVPPDDVEPEIEPGDPPGHYDHYGFRVPAVVISPYAKADYVSHVVHDHTSVLRLIETKWNLGALTHRDANASNLLDCLDLAGAPAFATPPELPAPADPKPPLESWTPAASS